MKLRYISMCFAALALVATSCSDEEEARYLSAGQVSTSYVTISPDGGTAKITLNANADWTMDYEVEYETDKLDPEKGKVNYIEKATQLTMKNDKVDNTWITVSPANGGAGTTEISFTAPATTNDRQSTLKIKIGDSYQTLVVSQKAAASELPLSTVADVVKNGTDGKTYRVKGSCNSIANTNYGNWYMTDDEGNSLYIYGTVDDSGANNWSSFNIEVGDIVTVEGPRTNYNGTIELVNATFIKVEKALLASKETAKTIEKAASTFTLTMTQKGETMQFSVDDNCDWLKFNPSGYSVNDKGDYVFTLEATENTTGATRKGTLYFNSTKGKSSTRLPITITQLATVSEANVTIAALRAKITSTNKKSPDAFFVELKDAMVSFVSGSNFFIEDGTAGLTLYNSELKLKAGDVITGKVWGSGYQYNGVPQATEFHYELAKVTSGATVKPTVVTLAELTADPNKYISRFVRLENATVATAIDVNYTAVTSAGSVTDGTNTVALNHQSTGTYKQKNMTKDDKGTKMYYYFQAAQGATVSFNAVPTLYKGAVQLNIYKADWLK